MAHDTNQTTPEAAARRTLERMGYTYHGGEAWKPPLGPAPNFNLLDEKNGEIERLRAELEKARVRFEMIARGHPGATAAAGAADAREALYGKR